MNYWKVFVIGTIGTLAPLALALAQDASANPSTRIQVPDIKPLLIRAIDQGTAQGVLVGEAASYVRPKFESSPPIEIDVRTLYALPQAGCSRLEVTTRQKDVLLAKIERARFASGRLQAIQDKLRHGGDAPSRRIARLAGLIAPVTDSVAES